MNSQSRLTSASPETVWRIWSDPTTWPSWNSDVKAISLTEIAAGAAGTMETKAGGKHEISIESVEPGRAFQLISTGIPGHRLAFRCEVLPDSGGSRISQGVQIRGPLAGLFNGMMGKRIAESFGPLLEGLKERAERS
ncbi:MAG: SRPBCC family protein [Chloroflexi bacterium]|nr:SRPBCC family protein [Chloroflexota bacterium]